MQHLPRRVRIAFATCMTSICAAGAIMACVSDGTGILVVPAEGGDLDGAAFGDGNIGVDAAGTNGDSQSTTDGPKTGPCVPNPANFDVPGNNCDDDGDGTVDNVPTCDSSLVTAGDGEAFAHAIGICQTVSATRWGLLTADYKAGFQSPSGANAIQHSILPKFGQLMPLEGMSLGVLSTGYAGPYDSDDGGTDSFVQGYQLSGKSSTIPPGFPKLTPGCPSMLTAFDVIDYSISVKVPANATAFEVSFDFYSSEWPSYVCTQFNDSFIVYRTSSGGAVANFAFDGVGNPITVNSAFIDRCGQGVPHGCMEGGTLFPCGAGPAELAGTGYGNPSALCPYPTATAGAATGWRTATVPVTPGDTIAVDFILWDTGDGFLDSTALVDNFHWKN